MAHWLQCFFVALQKNVLLRRHAWFSTLLEVSMPAIFMLLLSIGYWLASDDTSPAEDYVAKYDMLSINATWGVYDSYLFCNPWGMPNLPAELLICDPNITNMTAAYGFPLGANSSIVSSWVVVPNVTYAAIFVAFLANASIPFVIPDLDSYLILQAFESRFFSFNFPLEKSPKASLSHPGFLALVSDDESLTESFMHYCGNHSTLCLFYIFPQVFGTLDDARNYAYLNGNTFWAILDLSQLSLEMIQSPGGEGTAHDDVLPYGISMNYTATPWTFQTVLPFTTGLGRQEYLLYLASGFLTLQQFVNGFIIDTAAEASNTSQLNDTRFSTTLDPAQVVVAPMPTRAYFTSQFLLESGMFIPLVMTFAMLYGLSRVLSGIVEEKEGKVREALLIMGLPLSAFYSSWLVTSMMINLIACIGSSIVLKLTLFNSVNLVMMIVVNYCFALTIIAVSMLLSVFFSKPRIAAIFGPLLMFVSAVPYYAIPVGTATKYIVFASVLPCTAYAQAINIFISYAQNGYGVHWNNFFDGDYSIALSVVMMLFDTVVYLMLAMYLDLVLPSEYGTRRHPLFFLQCCCRSTRPRSDGHHEGGASSTTTSMATLRAEKNDTKDASLVDDLHERFVMHTPLVVDVQHLVKTYDTEGSSEPIRAVRDISFRLHQGCIHVLLGHNGAGKSTTINMLVGLVPPTSGDVSICGMSIATSLSTIRKNLGYCPQHNIIWPSLTVTQHLRVYARIKSSSWNVDDMVESTLELVQLKEKRNAAAGSLSGGQKRKLCVGISLIGNSPFLLLDEPTAGMDLEARRAMWELLQKIRKTRCVLLSTHFMDEADLLGDRVIIMSHGNIHSAGSPLFLKSRLGIGYSVTCVLEHERSSDALIHALQERYHQERSARGMDVDGSNTQASSRILDVTKRGKEVVVRFPMTFTSVAGGVFEMLENRKQELQVATFGLSLTTMEDVFLSIALLSGDVEQVVDGDTRFEQRVHGTARTAAAAPPPPRDAVGGILSEQEPLLNSSKKQDDHQGLPRRDVDDASTPTKNIGISAAVSHKQRQTFRTHFYALFCKRIHCAKRDRRMLCFQVVMPVAFLIIALLILLLHPPDQPPLVLNGSMYTERTDVPVSPAPELFTASGPGSIEALSAVDHAMYNIQTQSQCNNAYNNSMCLSQKLLQEYNTHTTPRYVAVAPYSNVEYRPPNGDVTWINATWSTILQNATAVHSAPEGLSYFSNLVFRSLQNRPTATIQVTNYPLTLSQAQQVLISSIRRIVSAIFILIPFTFIPANYVCFIVKEKECKAKHLQWVAGANMLSFWLSSMLWDMITYLCTEFLCIAVFFIFKRDEFVGDGPTFAATFLLFFMYGLASIPFSYVISFCFRNSSSAQNITMMGNFFAGFLLVMAAQILAAIPTTQETNRYLCKLYRVVPAYALGEGIITLTGRELAQLVMGRSIAPPFELLDYDNGNGGFFGGVGTSLIYLGITAPFFFGMLLVIELTRSWLLRSQLNIVKPQPNEADLEDYGHEDPDVMTERLAAESNTPTTSSIDDDGERKVIHGRSGDGVTVQHLRKVYPGNKLAVKHLSFGVKSGETFALLGTNGAGKTTTIATLTGEHTPTCGDAFINGSSIVKNMHEARQWIGYCPQFDALLEHMTPREHLVLYCRLRGLAPQETQAEVDRILTALCLEDYADTMAKSLSGGNKRKLSLAIALIGDTKCILLDEPTAGMDPVARRDLWKSLALVSEHRSIVLTTHHLEEVEALADRVGIMVRGKMMCLGTLQQLKSKFVGDVFELQLSFASPERREQEQDANRATVTMIHTVQQQQQPHVVVSTNKEATQHTNIHATEEEHQNALAMVHYLKAALAPEAVVDIAEVQGNKCVLCVEKAPLSQLFRLVEQRKVQLEDDFHKERSSVKVNGEAAASVVRRITEYSLSQATLEQVFLRIGVLARQEEEEEGGGGSH